MESDHSKSHVNSWMMKSHCTKITLVVKKDPNQANGSYNGGIHQRTTTTKLDIKSNPTVFLIGVHRKILYIFVTVIM